MPSAATLQIPAKVLTYFLSFAFIMAGLGKLHPSHPMHGEMIEKSGEWLEVLQLSALGIDAKTLRLGIGVTEVTFGLLLIATPAAAYALAFVMVGALYTHYQLDGQQFTPDMRPAAFLLTMILLLLGLQGPINAARAREEAEQAAASGKDQ